VYEAWAAEKSRLKFTSDETLTTELRFYG